MDERTLLAYDEHAAGYCDEWLSQPPAADLQRLWRHFFNAGGRTADIGSGSGRDVDWLSRNGYPCEGWDGSGRLVAEAGRRFPRWRFQESRLPELAGVPTAAYANVVCETVIMHLSAGEIEPAVRSLGRIVAPEGTLYLSWRVGADADMRDPAGRLYSAFSVQTVRETLAGWRLLYDVEETSESSGKRVQRLVARRDAR
ncbi:MAG: methyltransferase domain-containing protein [Betaproteobacteria bacterium]|nr:MAG: methyltransferase domain-containing protein [Betaproteobacteria bacterium]